MEDKENREIRRSDVLMNEFDDTKEFDEIAEEIERQILEYKEETSKAFSIKKVYSLFYGIYYYIYYHRPSNEKEFVSVVKLLGASKRYNDEKSPYARIIEGVCELEPYNQNIRRINAELDETTDKDVDDAFDFLLYRLEKLNPDDIDEAAGYITAIRQFCNMKLKLERKDELSQKVKRKLSEDIIEEYKDFKEKYTPLKIKEYLDQYIIGQKSAKMNVSSAVYNHILRGLYPDKNLNKSNVLMIGPSGCGKTEIVRRLKRMFKEQGINIPIVLSDFSGVVATPWKGRNKEEVLARLLEEADMNLTVAEHGIVFLDEFDKIVPKVAGGERGYDYNTELQGQMLGMLEGTSCQVHISVKKGDKSGEADILMRTDNILFILAGAFDGLEDIIRKNQRENESEAFGISSVKKSHIEFTDENITIQNLMDYGIRSELAGRIGNASVLHPISREDMINILKNAKDNIITKYQNMMFAEDGIELEFTDDAYGAIADRVENFGIGARGLNAILHDALADIMFEAPSEERIKKIVVNAGVINGDEKAEYQY